MKLPAFIKSPSWFWVIIFACGFLCAWLVKPARNAPLNEEAATARKSPQPRAVTARNRGASANKAAEARIARILDDGEKWQSGSAEDYPGLLTAIQRRAGFKGIDPKAERLLQSILTSWYDTEPDAALNWALGLGNLSDESTMLSVIVERCAENDWQAAVALAEQHGAVAGRRVDIPLRLIQEVMRTLSPEEFVRIDRLFTGRSADNDSRIQLGDDFRFAGTLNLYGADKKPQAVLEEWARRDFGAVWEWASLRDEPQFRDNSLLRTLSGIWARSADDDQIAGFAAYLVGKADGIEKPDRNLEITWQLLKERPASEVLPSVLAQAAGDRQEHFSSLLRIGATSMKFSKEDEMIREKLLGQMTPVELKNAFESNRNNESWSGDLYKEPLTRLGFSSEEIERMLPE